MLWSEIQEEEGEVGHKIVSEAGIPNTYEEPYVVLHCACYLYVSYWLYVLKAKSWVDTMLVSTSDLADVIAMAGINSKCLKNGGERKGSTIEASLK